MIIPFAERMAIVVCAQHWNTSGVLVTQRAPEISCLVHALEARFREGIRPAEMFREQS